MLPILLPPPPPQGPGAVILPGSGRVHLVVQRAAYIRLEEGGLNGADCGTGADSAMEFNGPPRQLRGGVRYGHS